MGLCVNHVAFKVWANQVMRASTHAPFKFARSAISSVRTRAGTIPARAGKATCTAEKHETL